MLGRMETGEGLDPLQRCLHDILREDPLSALLKTHIWIEQGLVRCVEAVLPRLRACE